MTQESVAPAPTFPQREADLRPVCSAAFASINTTLANLEREVRGVRADVKDVGKQVAEQNASVKGLWHEIRDDVKPAVAKFPGMVSSSRSKHEAECPARKRAMKRAEGGDSDTGIDASAFREPSQIVELPSGKMVEFRRSGLIRNTANGHYEVPRQVLWVGGLIGAAIAASGYVYHVLSTLLK